MNKLQIINQDSKFPDEHSDAINLLQRESITKTYKNKSDHQDKKIAEDPIQTQDSSHWKK